MTQGELLDNIKRLVTFISIVIMTQLGIILWKKSLVKAPIYTGVVFVLTYMSVDLHVIGKKNQVIPEQLIKIVYFTM